MRIAKASLVSPDQNFWYGLVAVTLSIFVFAYSSRFGQVSVLAYYAVWLPLVLVDYRHVLGNYARFHWIVAFAALACLSVFWSAAPGVTLRAGVQFASHIVCALIAARTVGIRTLTLGGLTGVFLVVLYSLAFGQYHHDPLDGTYSFVGAFASKNQLGLFSSLGLYFAFACIFILDERLPWRLAAFVCGVLSAYTLFASQSAASMITVAATLAILCGLKLVLLFSPRVRKIGILAGIVLIAVAAFIALNLGALDLVLGAFGKDATLTGRTYLWSEGWIAAGETPFAGVGYQAYWVQGFAEAERLWEEFYIGSRSGFHFHNTYIEVLVELGAVGLFFIVVLMVRIPSGHLVRLLDDRQDRASFVAFGLAVMFLVRSFVEVDVIHPYVVGSFLLYYAAGVLAIPQKTRSLDYSEVGISRLRHA